MDIREIASAALKYAKEAEHAEAYVVRTLTRSVYIDDSKIGNTETKTDSGLCIRVADKNKLGRSSISFNNEESVEKCAESAIRVSKFSPANNRFNGYPQPKARKIGIPNVFDSHIINGNEKDLMDLASAVINSCTVNIPRGQIRQSIIESVVTNSNGLETSHRSTMIYGHFTSMIKKKKPGEGIVAVYDTHMRMDPEKIGTRLSDLARTSADAKPFSGKEKMTMILPPSELGDMLMSSAGSAMNGENVFYKKSPWTGMEGKEVASNKLTITDNPSEGSPISSSFDDEGVPACDKTLIENGVLKSFIRDSFIGNSTGNGMRRNSTDAQGLYESSVTIKPMNLRVKPGNMSIDDIISATKNGIIIDKFAWPEADPLTGRFGLEVRCGRLIHNGKITGTINNALMMGNMIDALKKVENIGNDPECMGCVTIPTMSFSDIELVG